MSSAKNTKDKSLPKVETIISAHTVIKGNIHLTSGTVRVDGTIETGNITSEGIVIGTEGKIKGNLIAENIVVSGEVHGNIKAENSLEMLKEAKIFGDISTPNFIMAQGSIFEGNCDMKIKKSKAQINQPEIQEAEKEEEDPNKNIEKK